MVNITLGACSRREPCNGTFFNVNSAIGPKELHQKVLKDFSDQAQIFKKKTGRCAVLVIDNADRLASQNPQLLKFLLNTAQGSAEKGYFTTVFVTEGHVPLEMPGKL